MSLIKHQNSVNWYAAFMIDGKRYFKSTGTSNKALARKIEHEMKNKVIERNKLGAGKHPITLQKAIELFTKSRNNNAAYEKNIANGRRVMGVPFTVRGKLKTPFGFSPDKEAHTFTDGEIIEFITHRQAEGYKQGTIYAQMAIVRGALKHAYKLGYLTNPLLKFEPIKMPDKPIRYFTRDEERRLLDQLDPSITGQNKTQGVYDLAVLLLDLGLRIGEAVSLKWVDVDFGRRVIHITSHKVNRESYMHLSERLTQVLQRRQTNARCEWIFPNRYYTGPRGYGADPLRKAAKRAGIKDYAAFHILRKSYASKLLQNGVSLFEVSKCLHHRSITTTLRYAALAPNQASEAAVRVLNGLNDTTG